MLLGESEEEKQISFLCMLSPELKSMIVHRLDLNSQTLLSLTNKEWRRFVYEEFGEDMKRRFELKQQASSLFKLNEIDFMFIRALLLISIISGIGLWGYLGYILGDKLENFLDFQNTLGGPKEFGCLIGIFLGAPINIIMEFFAAGLGFLIAYCIDHIFCQPRRRYSWFSEFEQKPRTGLISFIMKKDNLDCEQGSESTPLLKGG